MKKNGLLLALIVLFSGTLLSQSAGNYVTQKINQAAARMPQGKNLRSFSGQTLTIEANALMNVKPDAQVAIFTVVQIGETAGETTQLIDKKINGIKKMLDSLGIDEKDIVTDMISFVPRYEVQVEKKWFSKTYTEIPAGFELKKNLHIRFRDHELIDKIIAACAMNEVYDLAKVEYVVEDVADYRKQMRTQLAEMLGEKIAFYHNLEVDDKIEITLINEYSNEFYPFDLYKQYTSYSSTSFDAIKGRKKDKTTVTSAKKNTSFFYEAVNARNFDLVINPDILEPTVQYTHKLTVTYVIPKEEEDKKTPEPKEKIVEKKQFILITPDGQTKTLDLE